MVNLLYDIVNAVEYASILIARPIIIVFFVIFTYQSVKVFHYMADKPFPARLGFGGLVLTGFAECVIRLFWHKFSDTIDIFFLGSLVISRESSISLLNLMKINTENFYKNLDSRMLVAKIILSIFAMSSFVYVFAKKELDNKTYQANLTKKDIETQKEKNELIKKDVALKDTLLGKVNSVIDKTDEVITKTTNLEKRSEKASKERKEIKDKIKTRVIYVKDVKKVELIKDIKSKKNSFDKAIDFIKDKFSKNNGTSKDHS